MFFGIFGFVFLFVPKQAKAQTCSGSATCGTFTLTPGRCVGGINDGLSCKDFTQCPGGSCQGIGSSCTGPFTKSCDVVGNLTPACQANCSSCAISSSCAVVNPPGPTNPPPPGGGGGGSCGAGCSSSANCGGGLVCDTWDFNPGKCWGGACNTGGGGDPCPNDSCPGRCCNYTCMNQFCVVTADCAKPGGGGSVYCDPTLHKCVNPVCPNDTQTGSLCTCATANSKCGDKCGWWSDGFHPLCGDGISSCSWLNSAPQCNAPNNATYCLPTNPKNGYTLRNCTQSAGYKYLVTPSGALATTQAQIIQACTTPNAWYQGVGGNLITNNSIFATLPAGATIMSNGAGGFPGNGIYGQSTNLTNANFSSKGWNTKTAPAGKSYDYSYFVSQIPSNATINALGSTAGQSNFGGGNVSSDGYYWFKANGDLTITNDITIAGSRKIILFVAGNLTINGRINVATKGQGFFMAIVNGGINVAGTVTNGVNPALEGIFVSSGFNSGNSANRLYIRGTVVNYGTLTLARDLGASNSTNPAETFEFAPDLVLLFPQDLTPVRATWKEVIP